MAWWREVLPAMRLEGIRAVRRVSDTMLTLSIPDSIIYDTYTPESIVVALPVMLSPAPCLQPHPTSPPTPLQSTVCFSHSPILLPNYFLKSD